MVKVIDNLRTLIADMKKAAGTVKLFETLHGLTKDVEVGPDSLVQMVERIKLADGTYGWNYYQTQFSKMPPGHQRLLEGAYHGETVGHVKVIGIYKCEPGLEMLIPK